MMCRFCVGHLCQCGDPTPQQSAVALLREAYGDDTACDACGARVGGDDVRLDGDVITVTCPGCRAIVQRFPLHTTGPSFYEAPPNTRPAGDEPDELPDDEAPPDSGVYKLTTQ